MRTCRTCKVEKLLSAYQAHSSYKDGLSTQCKDCVSEYRKTIRKTNIERDRNYSRKYKAKNREFILQRSKEYVLANPEKRKATMKAYRQANPEKDLESTRRRQAAALLRTPNWLTENDVWMMQEAYKLARLRTKITGFSWHVDHVLPLRGKIVSGLHTPYNLQVIPAKQNLAKANKVNP
jgi:hypothetical protein